MLRCVMSHDSFGRCITISTSLSALTEHYTTEHDTVEWNEVEEIRTVKKRTE